MLDFPIKTVNLADPGYPALLRQIHDPPKTLYYRGSLPAIRLFYIAMVGSRKISGYGQQSVDYLMSGLKGLPVCIVSGLARGADAQAHQAALDCGLPTIAVLGSGLDDASIYPRCNFKLAHIILASGGLLISAYQPGTPALQWHFPARNQIISGLSKAAVIIEAAQKSGALLTASCALEQNRDVFAVPGSIFQTGSFGPNNLIKSGRAKLVSEAADIINEYPELQKIRVRAAPLFPDPDLSAEEQKILAQISIQPSSFEQILQGSGLTPDRLGAGLVLLEIKNKIRALGNNCYARNLTNAKLRG